MMPQQTSLPTHLITGLLGSGKTTTLRQLLHQKPEHERWGIIINEFGEVDIDAATLQSQGSNDAVVSVSGGCICCSAQYGLTQAINQLLAESATNVITRLFIEPTGLGHPAKIIDTLTQSSFVRPLSLQPILCVITPQQLTPLRWQKSSVMRDLVTLSDIILLNKTDLSSADEQNIALELLQNGYPAKTQVKPTQQGWISLAEILNLEQNTDNKNRYRFTLSNSFEGFRVHQKQTTQRSKAIESSLPGVRQCLIQVVSDTSELSSIGWIFHSKIQFNRIKLKSFFTTMAPFLNRGKGLLKTGNEWQLINWSDEHLSFEDIAWRQDSRLELLFNDTIDPQKQSLKHHKDIENQLLRCISKTE
ncbi:CobW family GTP-binding protein [Thiomicrorhabdus arctica]|uniref:CobW family GTP-binding protein n=1 Tax=Thiomicrorhabdus arctica TaxID=131540 RepID=UPI000373C568|nr:GTP-binding protein [Thiomicrorhabdus arctica]